MSVVVVGDVLLDVDIDGQVDRLSPDAPVPVIDIGRRVVRAGGAGLVATLLARDGHDVTLVTVLGDDAAATQVRQALDGVRIVAAESTVRTPVKTRVRAAGHPIARLDENCGAAPSPVVDTRMLDAVRNAEAIIVADYGRGLAGDESLRQALAEAATRVPTVWDPHPRGARPVAGMTAVTPNLAEARAAAPAAAAAAADADADASADAAADDAATAAARPPAPAPTSPRPEGADRSSSAELRSTAALAERLREHCGADSLIVTMGSRGALLAAAGATPLVVPAPLVAVDDPCGAGDRLAATLVSRLVRGDRLPDALAAAVAAAAEFLAAGGVASLDAPPNSRRMRGPASDALEAARATRAAGGTVVATGGCFDLLHAGHARTLTAARALGDCLIVCLNSDASVTRLKGPERPIMRQGDRTDLLLALECVDAVVVFEEDTPEAVLSRLTPDIWVKGGDYEAADLPEARLVAGWGGQTVTVPFHPGRSTTRLAGALARVG